MSFADMPKPTVLMPFLVSFFFLFFFLKLLFRMKNILIVGGQACGGEVCGGKADANDA